MSLPRYLKSKDSGIEWLGEIPAHWDVQRLKYLGDALIGLTYDPANVVDEGDGVLVLRSSNVQAGRITYDDNVWVKKQIPTELMVRQGDILICSRNGSRALIGKNAMIAADAEGATFGAFMTIFRGKLNPYLFWVFNSQLFSFQSSAFLTSTVNQLTIGDLRGFAVPLPPTNEQSEVAAFLDRETRKTDALVKEQRKLIDLLKEKRQAVISHAVTKGLNPDVPMMDSGFDWLGKVPVKWIVTKLGHISFMQGVLGFENWQFANEGTRVICVTNITENGIDFSRLKKFISNEEYESSYAHFTVQKGDVLLSSSGNS